jgi:hypothetical protein
VALQRGWNLVAAPFPCSGLDTDTLALEIEAQGGVPTTIAAREATGGYATYVIPRGGPSQPLDLGLTLPCTSGFWVQVTKASTWTPT